MRAVRSTVHGGPEVLDVVSAPAASQAGHVRGRLVIEVRPDR